jgi:hypothetical protein
MSARKDGLDAVGSCLAGPVLTVPRVAPALKMFVNSRVGELQAPQNCMCIEVLRI